MLTTHPFFQSFCKQTEINNPLSLSDNLFFYCNKDCLDLELMSAIQSANLELADRYPLLIGESGVRNVSKESNIYHEIKKSFSLSDFDSKKMDLLMTDIAMLLCEAELIDSVCEIDW